MFNIIVGYCWSMWISGEHTISLQYSKIAMEHPPLILGGSSHGSFLWVSYNPSFLFGRLAPKSHWNHQGWFTHNHDSWDEPPFIQTSNHLTPPLIDYFVWEFPSQPSLITTLFLATSEIAKLIYNDITTPISILYPIFMILNELQNSRVSQTICFVFEWGAPLKSSLTAIMLSISGWRFRGEFPRSHYHKVVPQFVSVQLVYKSHFTMVYRWYIYS